MVVSLPEHYVNPAEKDRIMGELRSQRAPAWNLTRRQLCDLELILNGAFHPLTGFLGPDDYRSVVENGRLADGTLWPIPIMLDIPETLAEKLAPGALLELRESEGIPVAALRVETLERPDRAEEARGVFGTDDRTHPGVSYLLESTHPVYVSGQLSGLTPPPHYDFRPLRLTPNELRARFEALGWRRVIAFQTRNPLHRAHVELTFRAASELEANLLLHPSVGLTRPGDVDAYTRVRCYEKVLAYYPATTTLLALLPLAMRMGGPREVLLHMIIRRNFGASHFIVGRDHAGPGRDRKGEPFYPPYAAREAARAAATEIGIEVVAFDEMVYAPRRGQYVEAAVLAPGEESLTLSGTELRRRLALGLEIPEWFSYPEVIAELRRSHPPLARRGFAIFLTGFSGAGKSTIAHVLTEHLLELGTRPVTLLDGDHVRRMLSSELGFSREHRDLHIQRLGFVAAEIAKSGGAAICAPIAPYAKTRRAVRDMVESAGAGFIEVYVSTPLKTCEARDRKGLYARARAGLIPDFTGVSDPYEVPENPDLDLDTTGMTPEEAAQRIMLKLEHLGYLGPRDPL
ncbi:MAG: bifunctional sulfate adenylyltransferase/adenylylsulfate kinase [Gammaproteobacteria bacterium]